MFEYSKDVKRILDVYCQTEARRLNSEILLPEHILLSLLKDRDGTAVKILGRLGVNFDILKRSIDSNLIGTNSSIVIGTIPNSKRFNKIIEYAAEESRKMKNENLSSEHLLLALFRYSKVAGIEGLIEAGISYGVIREEIEKNSDGTEKAYVNRKNPNKPGLLDEFSYDLTALAMQGKIDPVIGRENEINRVVQILCRKTKNNPVLIGEAGVGKTAIAEGMALKIVNDEMPDFLKNRKILSLDIPGIVAGTKYRGEFEDRLKKILNEIKGRDDLIIFIDEMHTIMGAGAAEGAIDAANILKPFLARGEIQCVGATTLSEYRKHIEKDTALERRFQTVLVKEPSIPDAIKIVNGLKERYENHHLVKFTDEALEAAVKFSARYITDRYLPDKAIDIIDEAGARARLNNTVKPEEFVLFENEIEELVIQKKILVEDQKYEEAASLRDQINVKKKIMDSRRRQWENREGEFSVSVDRENILSVISQKTGIPLEKIEENESSRLLHMEEYLHEKIIGQDSAVTAVAKAIRRSRTGLKSVNRPVGSFIFAGPTGVGKTELAKVLSEYLFSSKSSLIRIDMSEFMEKHAVSRLIGSPPGYVGYEDGGQLTEKIRRNPFSVILFDEIEKAHHDFFNILLQILEEGELTDNNSGVVSFRNTIIIMTSNLGNSRFDKSSSLGFSSDSESKLLSQEKIMDAVKANFNPEFINRIDEIISFHSLDRDHVKQIASIQLDELKTRIFETGINLDFAPAVVSHIADKGYSEKYGARFIRKVIQTDIEDNLAMEILSGKFSGGSDVKVSVKNGNIMFKGDKKSSKQDREKIPSLV
ncbi:MAG: ATP-dependent Clp protease ATP-binding subunit [Spirochaetes bacterium]|nr:ATP-dependent Clp protease ATP-binding subunit [Spirochaetota bacterium]